MRTPASDLSRSRIHSWNIAFERRLRWDVSMDIAYVGTAKNGSFTDIDANASDVPGGDPPADRSRRSAATSRCCSGVRSPSPGITRCR